MTTFKIIVTNMGGLTSRSSAELVEEANHHRCSVTMRLEVDYERIRFISD